jgi:hypothetical protein
MFLAIGSYDDLLLPSLPGFLPGAFSVSLVSGHRFATQVSSNACLRVRHLTMHVENRR